MVSSMTGFGRGRAAQDGREMTVELKSVNHRYLDLSFRMPRHISFAEDTLRTALNDSLSRGHVDVYVNYRNTRSDAKEVRIDTALLGAYLKSVKAAAAELREENDMTLSNALRLPDVTDIVENRAARRGRKAGERPYGKTYNGGRTARQDRNARADGC